MERYRKDARIKRGRQYILDEVPEMGQTEAPWRGIGDNKRRQG